MPDNEVLEACKRLKELGLPQELDADNPSPAHTTAGTYMYNYQDWEDDAHCYNHPYQVALCGCEVEPEAPEDFRPGMGMKAEYVAYIPTLDELIAWAESRGCCYEISNNRTGDSCHVAIYKSNNRALRHHETNKNKFLALANAVIKALEGGDSHIE